MPLTFLFKFPTLEMIGCAGTVITAPIGATSAIIFGALGGTGTIVLAISDLCIEPEDQKMPEQDDKKVKPIINLNDTKILNEEKNSENVVRFHR